MFDNLFYCAVILVFFVSIFGVISSQNLLKKIICLNCFQSSVIIFFIGTSYKSGSFLSPVYRQVEAQYTNPVQHVLMLTAIVVGFAITAMGVALVMKISKISKSCFDDEVENFINNKL